MLQVNWRNRKWQPKIQEANTKKCQNPKSHQAAYKHALAISSLEPLAQPRRITYCVSSSRSRLFCLELREAGTKGKPPKAPGQEIKRCRKLQNPPATGPQDFVLYSKQPLGLTDRWPSLECGCCCGTLVRRNTTNIQGCKQRAAFCPLFCCCKQSAFDLGLKCASLVLSTFRRVWLPLLQSTCLARITSTGRRHCQHDTAWPASLAAPFRLDR